MAMNDLQLRQDVLDELEYDPSFDAADIGVATENGDVTLTGHVRSYSEKMAAEAAVRRVKGVRAIAQEIEVRYPGDPKTSDDQIARRALDILAWDAAVPHEALTLKVEQGLVSLGGEVGWNFQRNAAEAAVRRLHGVRGVVNGIIIKPKVRAADIQQKIESALKRHAEVEARQIEVLVADDKVTLRGKVDNWDERDAVELAAWSAPGVKSVVDHLTISK
jgi:osmotically-inducible protein OsmY